jgi:hypothetical protein
VALFSRGVDGSYQVPSAIVSAAAPSVTELDELLLIRVGQAAVQQLVATGRGSV